MPADPYRYFRIESRELLNQLGQGVLELEKGGSAAEVIPRLLRLAHTLKGAARVVRQPQIAEDAHALEDLFAALREAAAPPTGEQVNRMLALLDRMATSVAALDRPDAAQEGAAAGGRERPAPPGGPDARDASPVLRPVREELEALDAAVSAAEAGAAALEPIAARMESLRHLVDLLDSGLVRAQGAANGSTAPAARLTRVVDELRDRFAGVDRELGRAVAQIGRQVRQVRESAARLRLIPAGTLFPFLERAARDAAQVLNRPVRFEAAGGELRLDPDILSAVQGALLQAVRNAVAHGLETESERREAGKPAAGTVSLSVTRRGAWVAFVCRDDGRGVDLDAVRRVLVQTGRVRPADAASLDADALLRSLLSGGISTSDRVTDVAGRGIGLDVMREAAERLGGRLHMHTAPGQGTTVELVVPIAIASLQALLVEAGDLPAAVPLDAVRCTLRVAPEQVTETPQGHAVVHDGASVPFLSLREVLRQDGSTLPPGNVSAFLVSTPEGAAAFAVDRILGTAPVVVKPLGPLTPAAPGVIGVSLDTDMQPRPVLDGAHLVSVAMRARVRRPAESASLPPAILIVDDSLTTRMLEQSILESAGYRVGIATSGEEGLAQARTGEYALFLVDVEMPGMDGFTFVERVRADPALSRTPVILVTSRSAPEDRDRGRAAGADDYIVKSEFDQAALLERIRTLVGRS